MLRATSLASYKACVFLLTGNNETGMSFDFDVTGVGCSTDLTGLEPPGGYPPHGSGSLSPGYPPGGSKFC
jgi:hypothetical protein